MKKVISFSLWGNIRLYCIGAIKNAILAKKYFPEWICRYYYDKSVPEIIINYLKSLDNVEVIFINELNKNTDNIYKTSNSFGSIWRFFVMIDNDVDEYLICDTDSRLNLYLKTNYLLLKKYNFIRFVDLPSYYPIIACSFFGKKNVIKFNTNDIDKYKHGKFYCDQDFLKDIIFPQIKDNCISLPRVKHTCEKFFNIFTGNFVGQVLDEYDNPIDKNKDHDFNFKNNYDDLYMLLDEYKLKLLNL